MQPRAEPCVMSGDEAEVHADELISRLNEQLHEKDMKLTDVRLEALSSAHQLEQLREMLSRMKVKPCPYHDKICKKSVAYLGNFSGEGGGANPEGLFLPSPFLPYPHLSPSSLFPFFPQPTIPRGR